MTALIVRPRPAHPVAAPARRVKRSGSALLFAALLHVWPLLLLVSAKALVPVGYLAIGSGNRRYRNDVVLALLVACGAVAILLGQRPNEYDAAHLAGFALFILAVPLINHAVRTDRARLIRLLAGLSVANALIAFAVYLLAIDLSAFRGLNRIIGDDDLTHRVYFESSCLVAVFSVAWIRRPWLRWLCYAIVFTYTVFLAKSVFVVCLYLVNVVTPWLLRGTSTQRVAVIALVAATVILGPLAVLALRPDVALSAGIKLLQFETVLLEPAPVLWGHGWGHVIPEIINSPDQPYQIEMQLPMLVKQIGWLGVALYAIAMFMFVRSASHRRDVAMARWAFYLLIGFNNPWLLTPVWYLTILLMLAELDRRRR